MLSRSVAYGHDWDTVQEQLGIAKYWRWYDYQAPLHWLAVMIGRSFTSLDAVYDLIRSAEQPGLI